MKRLIGCSLGLAIAAVTASAAAGTSEGNLVVQDALDDVRDPRTGEKHPGPGYLDLSELHVSLDEAALTVRFVVAAPFGETDDFERLTRRYQLEIEPRRGDDYYIVIIEPQLDTSPESSGSWRATLWDREAMSTVPLDGVTVDGSSLSLVVPRSAIGPLREPAFQGRMIALGGLEAVTGSVDIYERLDLAFWVDYVPDGWASRRALDDALVSTPSPQLNLDEVD